MRARRPEGWAPPNRGRQTNIERSTADEPNKHLRSSIADKPLHAKNYAANHTAAEEGKAATAGRIRALGASLS